MVEQTNGTTNPQPVAQQPAAPTPSPVSMDTLVEVKVDGKVFQEPLSKVVASYQMQSAAERRFQEGNRLLTQHKGDIELAQRMKSRLATDPEGAILEMQQFAQERLGRPVRLPGAPATDSDSGNGTGAEEALRLADARRQAEIRELRSEIAGLRTTHQVETREREIETVMNEYPIWRGTSPEAKQARDLGKLTISAMVGANLDTPLSDLASEVHSKMLGLVTQQVTQVRDQRQERAETLQVAPTQGGTPAMTTANPDGWGTKKALRDGTWQAKLREYMTQMGRTR